MEFSKEYIEQHIIPISLVNPVKGFIGYKKYDITEGWMVENMFFCNTPCTCIFEGFFSWNRQSNAGFGVYKKEDIGEYEIFPKKKVNLLVRNPSGIENNEYFIIPYDCDIGYNKYEKGGGKENGNIRIFYKTR